MPPEKYNSRQAYSALVQARLGNGISKQIFQRWAIANAFPMEDEPECQSIKTYNDFLKLYTEIWSFD